MSEARLPSALGSEHLDDLGHTVISLAKELWVLHDRMRVMESRLRELGLELDLDDYQPPAELASELQKEREAFVANLLKSLAGSTRTEGAAGG